MNMEIPYYTRREHTKTLDGSNESEHLKIWGDISKHSLNQISSL